MSGKRPNFLIFVVDQMRADHLSSAGNAVVETPNLDALAKRGVRFERCYVNNPVCMPSRATLMTGHTPRGHGVRTNGISLDPSIATLPGHLQQAGYRTHAVGKLHHTNYQETPPPLVRGEPIPYRLLENRELWMRGAIERLPAGYAGFETTEMTGAHGPGIFGDYLNWLKRRGPRLPALLEQRHGVASPTGAEQSWTMALPEDLHYNTWVADRMIDFLRSQESTDRPFFAWCSFPDPHHPFAVPEPWASRYDPAEVELPVRRDGELGSLPPFYQQVYDGPLQLSGRYNATRMEDAQIREIIARTYGMVSMVDANIGRVVGELEHLGLTDHTVIVFLSDHGDMLGDHWMINKGPFHFDGLLRVPMIWSWPNRFAEGKCVSALASHLDFMPTALDVAGVAQPDDAIIGNPDSPALLPSLPGVSQRTVLTGQQDRVQTTVLVENDEDYLGMRVRTLITEQYQLTIYPGHAFGELFGLANDPSQLHNLWNESDYNNVKRELGWQLMERMVETENSLPRRRAHA